MKKIAAFLIIFVALLGINTAVYGKYVIEYTNTIANIDIDRNPPKIEMLNIENTNTGYEKYANQTHTITAKIKVTEKNIIQNNFNKDNVQILIGGQVQNIPNMEISQIEKGNDYIIYKVVLQKILGDGILEIKVNAGTIIDKSNNQNKETKIATGITIDNTAPTTTFKQDVLENGKVNAIITANEGIRIVEGWKILDNNLSLSKQFPSNASYSLEITDYAQNKSEVEINITQATNIQINYGAFCFEKGWLMAQKDNPIAGKELIQSGSTNKVETMGFRILGQIDDDFIQVRNYLYSYWGEGSEALSERFEYKYHHGYIPENNYCPVKVGGGKYTNRASVNGKDIYTLMGGDGVNLAGNRDLTNSIPIPEEIAKQNLYGISALQIKLKDYSEYSIVYQIYINGYGWLKAASDGEETTYGYDKPITAYRIVLIPKTEKGRMIQTWNKDVGTSNVN